VPRKLRPLKRLHGVDDYHIAELFSLQKALLAFHGYWGDEAAIAAAWATLERPLIELWITGWEPRVRFLMRDAAIPGAPGTRPVGWWKYCAREPRRKQESEVGYLRRKGLIADCEEELLVAHTRRAAASAKTDMERMRS
jgi:hypothetical protein